MIISNGLPLHGECCGIGYSITCNICQKEITGTYSVDYWGNCFHTEHSKEYPKCEYCGRIISKSMTKGSKKYDDGRDICSICLALTINTINARSIQQCYEIVSNIFGYYGITLDKNIPIKLSNKQELKDLQQKRKSNDVLGLASGDEVYILTGMPIVLFIKVLAHELMHVWTYRNCPNIKDMNSRLCEGTANLASYLTLIQIKDNYAKLFIDSLMNDPDKIYGDGFRLALQRYKRAGMKKYLQMLKQYNDFY